MKSSAFSAFILLLAAFWLNVYSELRFHYSGVTELRQEVSDLSEELRQEETRTALARFESESLRSQIASTMGSELNPPKDYSARNIASVVFSDAASEIEIEPAGSIFSEAREAFNSEEYLRANRGFERIIEEFPYSKYTVESYFLLVEGLYQDKRFDRSIEVADKMVSLFPESDLTGFSLLRVAGILRDRGRIDDASEVYLTILKHFQSPDLTRQARTLLKEIQL